MKTLILLLLAHVAPALSLDLNGAYQLALSRSEDLRIQEEQINQAEERVAQAKGALFPTINAVGTFQKQDSAATFATAPTKQNMIRLNVSQPLFKGLRDFALIRQQKKNSESLQSEKEQAQVQLFSDVSQAFYQMLSLENDLKILTEQVGVNQQRLKELRSFRKIGRTRESDVIAVEASMAALDSAIESARVQIEVAWSVLQFLTGLETKPKLEDRLEVSKSLKPLSEYVAKLNNRPDLKKLELSAQSMDEAIGVARGGHLPSLDLFGNYYFERPGVLSPVKWDVQLAVTFPIFQGGVIQSQVRQATSAHQQAEILYERSKRQAQIDVELLYKQVQIEMNQQKKQKLASDLAQKNYQAFVEDSRFGLVTNIDVLQTLSTSQDRLRQYNRVYHQLKMDYMRLLAASGVRSLQ